MSQTHVIGNNGAHGNQTAWQWTQIPANYDVACPSLAVTLLQVVLASGAALRLLRRPNTDASCRCACKLQALPALCRTVLAAVLRQ